MKIANDKKSKGILSGYTVLDLSSLIAGPYCASLLGDLGADVIKIEPPWGGDELRHIGLMVEEESALFIALNRNKKSITLNLKTAEGREILDYLIADSDILVENIRPEMRLQCGLMYERVREIKPNIIHLSITSFGEDGPYRLKPGADQVLQGISGLMSVSGDPGLGPTRLGVPVANMATALFSVYGVLAALLHRQNTGEGQMVSVNLLDTAMCLQTMLISTYLFDGKEPGQIVKDNLFAYPVGCFKTKDGYINISAFNDKFWVSLCSAMGIDSLINDSRFNTADKRLSNKESLRAILAEQFLKKGTQKWLKILEAADVPCGDVYTYDTLFSDPQVIHNA
ncbi:MAG: CoA transferase, partial [Deltaproteobacteria bacterium]|nr:CoA transferase [Deltaproteobacteria bacterium]